MSAAGLARWPASARARRTRPPARQPSQHERAFEYRPKRRGKSIAWIVLRSSAISPKASRSQRSAGGWGCTKLRSATGYANTGSVPSIRRVTSRRPLEAEDLAPLVAAGLSTAEIATKLGRSKTTIRHWLREFGLATRWAERRIASSEGRCELVLECARHGAVKHVRRRSGGYRCGRCRAEAVSRRRRKVKRLLVEEAGGACRLCGYDRCVAALEFHHVVPSEKRFALSHRGVTRSLREARTEARRCVLLCANCHAEVEAGIVTLPAQIRLSYNDPTGPQ